VIFDFAIASPANYRKALTSSPSSLLKMPIGFYMMPKWHNKLEWI
jgi:hypothetical protein